MLNDPSSGTLLHYIGDDTTATQFPHGNRKRDSRSHFWTCPLVLKRLTEINDTPANVYKLYYLIDCNNNVTPGFTEYNNWITITTCTLKNSLE